MSTTWRKEITKEMKKHGDLWKNVESKTISNKELNVEFDASYGQEEGMPFTVWTKDRVYFPACYDGSEWCASVSRNPNGETTGHIGG